jgi:NTP pyrophosphatase (non-canonical NTP hydrolase)
MARTPRKGSPEDKGAQEADGPEGLKKRLGRFDKASGLAGQDPRSLAFSLVVEAAELASLFTAEAPSPAGKPDVLAVSRLREEIGDVVMGLMRLCTSLGIDPVSAAEMRVLLLDSERKAAEARAAAATKTERKPRLQDRRGLLQPPGEEPQEDIEIPDEAVIESVAELPAAEDEGMKQAKGRGRGRGRKPGIVRAREAKPEPPPALVTPPPPVEPKEDKKPARKHHRRGKSSKPPAAGAQPVPEQPLVTPPPPDQQAAKKPPSRRHRRRSSAPRPASPEAAAKPGQVAASAPAAAEQQGEKKPSRRHHRRGRGRGKPAGQQEPQEQNASG